MQNLSLKQEPIRLIPGKDYFFMDVLYLQELKDQFSSIDLTKDFFDTLKNVFPYMNFPCARYTVKEELFYPVQVKPIYYDDAEEGDVSVFVSDTGCIAVIQVEIIQDFVSIFDYDKLYDANYEEFDLEYLTQIEGKFEKHKFAIINLVDENGIGGGGVFRVIDKY